MPTTKLSHGHVLKSLPSGVAPAENGFWAIATKEIKDTDGDIVRVKGIDTSKYHNPPERHIKLLAGHARSLPSGEPPIIGRIEEFVDCDLDGVPAKLFRATWAPSELASKYKSLFDAGYLDSFSIGFIPGASEGMKGGGRDYKESSLFEISAVTVPANPEATAIVRRELGEDVASELKTLLDEYTKQLRDEQNRAVAEITSAFTKRFDDFESSYVAKTHAGTPSGDPEGATPKLTEKQLADAIRSLLNK